MFRRRRPKAPQSSPRREYTSSLSLSLSLSLRNARLARAAAGIGRIHSLSLSLSLVPATNGSLELRVVLDSNVSVSFPVSDLDDRSCFGKPLTSVESIELSIVLARDQSTPTLKLQRVPESTPTRARVGRWPRRGRAAPPRASCRRTARWRRARRRVQACQVDGPPWFLFISSENARARARPAATEIKGLETQRAALSLSLSPDRLRERARARFEDHTSLAAAVANRLWKGTPRERAPSRRRRGRRRF